MLLARSVTSLEHSEEQHFSSLDHAQNTPCRTRYFSKPGLPGQQLRSFGSLSPPLLLPTFLDPSMLSFFLLPTLFSICPGDLHRFLHPSSDPSYVSDDPIYYAMLAFFSSPVFLSALLPGRAKSPTQ